MESGGMQGREQSSTGEAPDDVEDAAEGASNYVEHVDMLSLATHPGPPPRAYWRTVREVIRIKRERAAAEALVSLPANLVLAQPSGAPPQHAQPQPVHPLEQTVRLHFERAVAEAAPPRQARCKAIGATQI